MSSSGESSPTDAFGIIDDGTRVAILRVLAERQADAPHDPYLSFSELRERVGTEDSGRFNYHLDRLRERFVEQTPEGYKLSHPGQRVVSTVLSGAYEPGDARGPVDVGVDCPVCGEPMAAAYEDGVVTVTCEDDHGFGNGIPPGALDGRDLVSTVALMSLTTQQEIELALEGVCPRCYGHAPPKIRHRDDYGEGNGPGWLPDYLFVATCERCGMSLMQYPGGVVHRHPAVVSLFYEHGIDVRDRPVWDLEFVTREPTVVSTDPLRLAVIVAVEDDALELTLDETASVVDVESVEK